MKNSKDRIRVMLRTYEGRRFIDLRQFFLSKDNVLLPSPKGFAIQPQQIQPLIQALKNAETEAKAQGLLPDADQRKAG